MSTIRSRLDIPALCEALDTMRIRRSLNWKQVSEATGVSQSTLSRMTLHGKAPDIDGFLSLIRWLGISAERFYANGHPGIMAR
jgi:transcriptional regulator with XRE-family HTH domain